MNLFGFVRHLALCVSIFAFFSAQSTAQQTLSSMQGMFNDTVSNATPGGSFNSQRRGVIAGPGYYRRNQIQVLQPINITPPRLKPACGSIDAFTGSISFINADQLIAFMRNIAAVAPSYAFQIALSSLCKDCERVMSELQKMANTVNSWQMNSCEATKRLTELGLKQMNVDLNAQSGLIDVSAGADWLSKANNFLGGSPAAELKTKQPAAAAALKLERNIAFEAAIEAGIEIDTVEAVMAYTGTTVVKVLAIKGTAMAGEPNLRNTSDEVKTTVYASTIGTKEFLEGGSVIIRRCSDWDTCLTLTAPPAGAPNSSIFGMRAYVERMLFGSGAGFDVGIVGKISSKINTFTQQEKNFIDAAPGGVLTQLKWFATSPETAAFYAQVMTDMIAVEFADHFLASMLIKIASATQTMQPDDTLSRYVDDLKKKKLELLTERNSIENRLQGIGNQYAFAKNLKEAVRAQQVSVRLSNRK